MAEGIIYPPADTMRIRSVAPLDEYQITLDDALSIRIASLTEWLEDHAPSSRRELASFDAETSAQLFWHYGYLMALQSVQSFMKRRRCAMN